MEEIKKVLKKIKNLIKNEEFIKEHKREEKDFTREVKIGFADVVTFILGKTGNTFDLEKYKFCEKMKNEFTTSAMCQARAKVKYTAFETLLKETSKIIEPKNLYKGYRITSYDGMQGELPRTAELMKKYRVSEKSQYPKFHAMAEYDVLNCCYTNAIFEKAPANERELAIRLLDKHDYEGKEIFLLDRGFPSLKMIQKLEQSGKKYIMRVSKSFLKEINEFTKSKKIDEQIDINFDKRRLATNRVSFDAENYSVELRCVKIQLPKNKSEILVTNLSKDEMSRIEIGELYNLRWRVETAFLDLKYAVHIEDFLGKKEEFIKQEFFTSLIQANLSMLFMDISNTLIKSSKKKRNLTTQ
jgi:hypothetical protein